MPKDNSDSSPLIIAARAQGNVARLNMELAINNKVENNNASSSASATTTTAATSTGGVFGGFIRPKRDPNDLDI